jgi:hypothetical protein
MFVTVINIFRPFPACWLVERSENELPIWLEDRARPDDVVGRIEWSVFLLLLSSLRPREAELPGSFRFPLLLLLKLLKLLLVTLLELLPRYLLRLLLKLLPLLLLKLRLLLLVTLLTLLVRSKFSW